MVEEEIVETEEPDILDNFRENLTLSRDPESLLSLISSITAKQGQILNYIFTTEMMTLENTVRGDTETPIMNVYNGAWLLVNMNMFFKPQYADKMSQYSTNVGQIANQGMKFAKLEQGLSFAQQQQVITLINESSMRYVTKLGDDIKDQLGKVLREGLEKGSTVDEVATKMRKVYDMNGARARTIARTELMRAANTAAFAQAIAEGAVGYSIDGRAEFCQFCRGVAKRGPYPISDKEHMPPLHPNCACVPIFSKDQQVLEDDQAYINKEIDKQRKALEDKGLVIDPGGTGAHVNKQKPEERIHN